MASLRLEPMRPEFLLPSGVMVEDINTRTWRQDHGQGEDHAFEMHRVELSSPNIHVPPTTLSDSRGRARASILPQLDSQQALLRVRLHRASSMFHHDELEICSS